MEEKKIKKPAPGGPKKKRKKKKQKQKQGFSFMKLSGSLRRGGAVIRRYSAGAFKTFDDFATGEDQDGLTQRCSGALRGSGASSFRRSCW